MNVSYHPVHFGLRFNTGAIDNFSRTPEYRELTSQQQEDILQLIEEGRQFKETVKQSVRSNAYNEVALNWTISDKFLNTNVPALDITITAPSISSQINHAPIRQWIGVYPSTKVAELRAHLMQELYKVVGQVALKK